MALQEEMATLIIEFEGASMLESNKEETPMNEATKVYDNPLWECNKGNAIEAPWTPS